MNILILDEEIYLAQKVALKLQEEGNFCTHISNIKEVNFNSKYDTILLSTNISSNDVHKIISSFEDSTIILLVSYVNDTTVSKPLRGGAVDYIVKPFIMDELIRKIYHYKEFKELKKQNQNLQNYLELTFCELDTEVCLPKSFPFVIETKDQKIADKLVLDSAKKLNKSIKFISLQEQEKVQFELYKNQLIYIYNFHYLKKSSQQNILSKIKNLDVIISSYEPFEDNPYPKIEIKSSDKLSKVDSILTINDYVMLMIKNFQDKYPDTELSKRLGISRKSLWEKRKKFGIEKNKGV